MAAFESIPPSQVDEALALAKASFPSFGSWDYCNQDDQEHDHFCLWGRYCHGLEYGSPVFFVTLDRRERSWRAHLTLGQHYYMWTCADFGDARVVSTHGHTQAEEALGALQQEMAALFGLLLRGPQVNDPQQIWQLWRMGDDGNAFLINSFVTEEEAGQALASFEAGCHKQTYWVSEFPPE